MSNNNNWQQKLEDIEAEINRATTSASQNFKTEVRPRLEINPSPQVKQWLKSGRDWFESLPQVGKIAVGIGAVWLSFSLLSAFLHIVSSIISIAVMGLILYVGYKLVIKSDR
ncbi:MAG: hypothetical protein ACFCU5_04955 [Pleurocapsa sp.]